MIVCENGDVTDFIPIIVRRKPVEVTVEMNEERNKWHHVVPSSSIVPVAEETIGLVGCEYPVHTESGIVIGRARIEIGRIVILGPKWAKRTA